MISKVDFAYAFAAPHRVTAAMPVAPAKSLVDITPETVTVSWIYDDLRRFPPECAMMLPGNGLLWNFGLTLNSGEMPLLWREWRRMEGWIPSLAAAGSGGTIRTSLRAVPTPEALVLTIECANTGPLPAAVECECRAACRGGYGGWSPHWIDPEVPADHLLAGWHDRADRVLLLAGGMDAARAVPAGPTHGLVFSLELAPGETKHLRLVRPYEAYQASLPELRRRDWQQAELEGLRLWRDKMAGLAEIRLPDERVTEALKAAVADIFVMQEPAANGGIATGAGTQCYRAPNSTEGNIADIALAQFGFAADGAAGLAMSLAAIGSDGDWNDPQGWGHTMWFLAGFKAWCVVEYYRLAGDRAWLEGYFPSMLKAVRWQKRMRATTQRLNADGSRPATYGLMPRGFGDCGLIADGDWYGVFYPHNFYALLADALTLEAARILGRTDLLAELEENHRTALADLRASLAAGSIAEEDYRWIPAAPGCRSGSRYGALCAAVPCGVLACDDPLIEGTLRYLNSNLTPDGGHLHTGWMEDGLWVAMELDNIAPVHLARNEGDAAARLLYLTLNRGTPLYSWCEERGAEAGSPQISGDLQHLWTPVAVARYLHDALAWCDEDTLHLARGVDAEWFAAPGIEVRGLPTRFGKVSYSIAWDAGTRRLAGWAEFPRHPELRRARLELRLPGGESAPVLTWDNPAGRFEIKHGS